MGFVGSLRKVRFLKGFGEERKRSLMGNLRVRVYRKRML